ncbi:peptide ABC transporter permease [Bacillus sp. FJAT-27264]|uniref:ABC transporter permease n=1 Tax=Paenibacillus sp. (strain DSM 101736 / FJAT-27264) TaxID=1850362 RepID=UPI0008080EFF|nr:ABC transporter permease [Bacillus sp. FJAT-27264]OBZ08361.1 peptide ABC transporter permease [Bacillus sp. FJAT-27264]
MAGTIVTRLLTSLLVVVGSSMLVFLIMYVLPGDPVLQMLDGNATSPEAIADLRHQLGLDQPFYEQFSRYFIHLLQGDFGHSRITQDPVLPKILEQVPATLALTFVSAAVSIVVGILLGVLSAIHRNGIIDVLARFVGLFGISMPSFWTGILLLLLFSIKLGWFPAMGSGSWKTLVLPGIALGLVGAGFIVRMVRNTMLEIMSEPFILTLRAKGLAERAVMYRHALRNSLIPALTMIGVMIGELLSGTVVIETVFARQGIGRILADAIMAKDIPVVQGVVFFTAIIYVSVNVLVDISYSLVDPRIRRST